MKIKKFIRRKTLIYKTGVEYGDYTLNHVQGCSHGCLYPCYAYMMCKRFGKVKTYEEWISPCLVENALELLEKEIPKYKKEIKSLHLCFSTDPFMYGYEEVSDMSIKILKRLNQDNIKCTVLTKGLLPIELANLSKENEYGITLVSLNNEFKNKYEPYSANYTERIENLRQLHLKGCKTWVSIEPYPTPNIVEQDITKILDSVSFVDKVIFGRLNYNSLVSQYKDYKKYYNDLANSVKEYCQENNIDFYIKKGTISK